jgi:hypothetical protein
MTSSKAFILFLLLFFTTISFFSCKPSNQKNEILEIIQEWQGKEILFPKDITFTIHGVDTVAYEIPATSHKILVYVDSVGCTSCRLHFNTWRELIYEIDSLTNATVPVLFFFHTKNPREISHFLRRDEINIPVVFDLKDELNRLNLFPTNQNFQTFLLDEENRVIFIGSPVNGLTIREMYVSEILGESHQSSVKTSQTTQIEVSETAFDLDTIPKGEVKTVAVSIKNIGEAPLIIFDTRVSCGCTQVTFDRQPTLPNSRTELSIRYNADDVGRFDRTISIFGNMADSPLVIRLRGVVE